MIHFGCVIAIYLIAAGLAVALGVDLNWKVILLVATVGALAEGLGAVFEKIDHG